VKNRYRVIREKGWPYKDKWLVQRSRFGLFWVTIHRNDVDSKPSIDEIFAETKRVEAL